MQATSKKKNHNYKGELETNSGETIIENFDLSWDHATFRDPEFELSQIDLSKEQISLDTVDKDEETSQKELSTEFLKLDTKTTVPQWHISTDPKINIQLVERYIQDLRRTKT